VKKVLFFPLKFFQLSLSIKERDFALAISEGILIQKKIKSNKISIFNFLFSDAKFLENDIQEIVGINLPNQFAK